MSLPPRRLRRLFAVMMMTVLAPALVAAAPVTVVLPLPADARVATDFATDAGKGPEALTDNDPKTFLYPGPNSAARPATLQIRFAAPVNDLAGVATGDAEPFKNYFAEEIRFYVDTDGDGYCETYVGTTTALGPGAESRGTHLFGRKPPVAHGLDLFVVRQSRRGVQRAFTLNELQLVHSSDAFGDANLPEPTDGPKRSGPPTVRADVATPVVLLDVAQKPRLRLNKDKENKQEARYIDDAGKPVYRVTWAADSKEQFAEIVLLNDPPVLHGLGAGVVLSVPVNADGFTGFDSIGARVRDANGETFRWSGQLDPKIKGWQDVRIAIDPATHQGNWGGSEQGRGTIDAPVQLVSLTLNAPTRSQGPGSVLLGTIRRNEVRAQDVSFTERMNSVTVTVAGPRKAAVINKGEERELNVQLQNGGAFPVVLRLTADLRSYDGQAAQWSHGEAVTLAPGGKASVPLNVALPRMGWWSYDLILSPADGSTEQARKLAGSFAYIDAVGPRPRTPDDFQFGIGGTGSSDDTAAAAVLIGSDWTRGGLNWNDVEKEPGKFDWRKLDEQVVRAEKFGYEYQHLLGYGNVWASRPGYVERYKPKEGWWHNTLAPQVEPWRNFVRTAAERYKGRVHYWEIWNEPDLSAFFKGTTDDYLELLKVAYSEIKTADPQAKVWTAGFATVGGHGGHNLNPGLQRRVIAEGQDWFDAVAHHEHGTFRGFQQAVDGELADMRKALRSPKPLAFNETAIDAKRGLEFQARTLVKKIAYAKARGGQYYSWFHIYRPNDHEGFGMLNNEFQPRPIYPAFNEVVRQLRDKPYLADASLGEGRYGLQFGSGTDQVIVAWREDDDVADALAAVRLPNGATATRVDIMGNVTPLTPASSGAVVFAVVDEPTFVVVRGAGRATLPVELVLSPLANVPDDRPTMVQVTAKASGDTEAVASVDGTRLLGGTGEVSCPADSDGKPASSLTVLAAIGDQRHTLRVPIRRTITVPLVATDGRRPDFVLDQPDQVVSFFKNDPGTAHRDWKGPADLSGKVWLALDGQSLRVRVDATDDRAHQPFTGNDIWKADGLQIGIEPPGAAGFYEIGIAAGEGADAQVVLLNRPGGAPSGNLLGAARATATAREGGVVYDLTLPLKSVGLTDAAARDGFRFNLVINDSDNDGAGRDGLIQIAPGIGLFKDALLFPVVRFR